MAYDNGIHVKKHATLEANNKHNPSNAQHKLKNNKLNHVHEYGKGEIISPFPSPKPACHRLGLVPHRVICAEGDQMLLFELLTTAAW